MLFPFLTLILIFIIVTAVLRSMSSKRIEDREEKFWSREEEAEHTPPVDLSTLSYITMPASGFHFCGEGEEAELMEAELMELSQKPMLNLNGMTNTDVKLAYGTSNFEKVQEIGENYDRLIILLADYAKLLMEQNQLDAAIEVLNFGIEIGSDISSNYTLLGDCYERLGQPDKIRDLMEKVGGTNMLLKPKIMAALADNLDAVNGSEDSGQPDGRVVSTGQTSGHAEGSEHAGSLSGATDQPAGHLGSSANSDEHDRSSAPSGNDHTPSTTEDGQYRDVSGKEEGTDPSSDGSAPSENYSTEDDSASSTSTDT